MPRTPSIGKLHNIRVNDAAYFPISVVEIVSNLIINTQRI